VLRYVSTGTYFGRVKIDGKIFRESLKSEVFHNSQILLGNFIKKKRKRVANPIKGSFAEARTTYEANLVW
jgi:hypothetical protein